MDFAAGRHQSAKARGPGLGGDEYPRRGSCEHRGHRAVDGSESVVAKRLAATYRIRDFVEHHCDVAAAAAAEQHQAQRDVHRFHSECVRDVFDQHSCGPISIQYLCEFFQAAAAEVIGETIYAKVWRMRWIGRIGGRRIDADFIAGFGKSVCDQARVIADASRLWRILAGNDVPCGHFAGGITSTTGGPGRTRPMDRAGRSRVRRAVHSQRERFRRRRG